MKNKPITVKVEVELERVESSNIKAIGYLEGQETLIILFKGGDKAYTFYPILPVMHKALMAAESKGKHFNEHIKHIKGLITTKIPQ